MLSQHRRPRVGLQQRGDNRLGGTPHGLPFLTIKTFRKLCLLRGCTSLRENTYHMGCTSVRLPKRHKRSSCFATQTHWVCPCVPVQVKGLVSLVSSATVVRVKRGNVWRTDLYSTIDERTPTPHLRQNIHRKIIENKNDKEQMYCRILQVVSCCGMSVFHRR